MSQFTLLASTKKGSKPDFHGALGGDEAKRLYQYFFQKVQQGYGADRVKDGVFQAMMEVSLVNDGPVSCMGMLGYFHKLIACTRSLLKLMRIRHQKLRKQTILTSLAMTISESAPGISI